jgi:hypothetical protein
MEHPLIPGYTYGTDQVTPSPISLGEWEHLKQAATFGEEDERYLRLAGEVLADQTAAIVRCWRGVIAAQPHLARYSAGPDGHPDAHYSSASGARFEQWILDTCRRPYDQDWLNYQHEIALRHTSLKKNTTDGVESAPSIPLRYVLAFTAVVNETIRPFLAARGHSASEVEAMHRAWCKSVQLQVTLWSLPYTTVATGEW